MSLSLSHSIPIRALLVAALCLEVLGACTKSNASPGSATFAQCIPREVTARDDPKIAFAVYAQLLNNAEFCDALGFFDDSDRVDVALTAFRALAIAAGGQSPKQAEYAAQFSEVCKHYGLNYSEPSAFVGLFLSLLNDENWSASIPNVRNVASKDPASFYTNVMRRLHKVQPRAMPTFSPELSELAFGAEAASAKATRTDGKSVSVAFRQTPHGWRLTSSSQTF